MRRVKWLIGLRPEKLIRDLNNRRLDSATYRNPFIIREAPGVELSGRPTGSESFG